MRMRPFRSAVALIAAGMLVAACSSGGGDQSGSSGGSPAAGDPVSGGDLVIARGSDNENLLGQETSSNADIWLLQQVYETLTTNRTDGTGVDPGLATDWSVSDDGLTWTFNLREGVTFHDGSDMTADDVKWSLDFAFEPSDTNAWYSYYEPVESVDVEDDYTIKIVLSTPWSGLPQYLGLFSTAIFPEDFGGNDIAYMREHTIGTGPFTVDTWTRGQSITLVKNDDYWDSAYPYLDSITFNVVADDSTRASQLQGGQIDIDEGPAASSMATLSNVNGVVATDFPTTKVLYYNVNNRVEGLDDPVVRRAMSYAIDRQSIIDTILAGFGEPANTFLSSSLFGHDDTIEGAVYDVDKAKELMSQSDHPDGFDMTIIYPSGDSEFEGVAQIAQDAWSKIGLDVTLQPLDAATARQLRNSGDYDVQVGYATSDVTDPAQMIDFLILTKDRNINSGFENDEISSLLSEVMLETDADKQTEIYSQIQQVADEYTPIIPIAYQPLLYAYSDRVQGFEVGTLGTYTFRTTYLSD